MQVEFNLDSAEKLISSLSFSAKELENAVQKVEKNRDLSKILNELSALKSGDFEEKIQKNLLKKMEKYTEVFAQDDIQKTLDQIENIEKFTKNFKFKSVILSVFLGFFAGFTSSYFLFFVENIK